MSPDNNPTKFETFIEEMKWCGFFEQCTDEEGLTRLLAEETVTAYIGFDPTADSLHIGSLLPTMGLVHGAEKATAAEKAAEALFSDGADSTTVPSSERPSSDFAGEGLWVVEALVGAVMMKSNGEARWMIKQKAVRLGGEVVLQVGKKRYPHVLLSAS